MLVLLRRHCKRAALVAGVALAARSVARRIDTARDRDELAAAAAVLFALITECCIIIVAAFSSAYIIEWGAVAAFSSSSYIVL